MIGPGGADLNSESSQRDRVEKKTSTLVGTRYPKDLYVLKLGHHRNTNTSNADPDRLPQTLVRKAEWKLLSNRMVNPPAF